MRKRKTIERPVEQVATKAIGITVPVPLHREFRKAAEKQRMTASALLRKIIIQHLDSEQAKS